MSSLVTLEEAKDFLNVVHNYDDAKIQMLLDGAESEVETFLNTDLVDSATSNGFPTVWSVAVLLLVQAGYEATPEDALLLRKCAELKLAPWRLELGC